MTLPLSRRRGDLPILKTRVEDFEKQWESVEAWLKPGDADDGWMLDKSIDRWVRTNSSCKGFEWLWITTN
jgi:hypothetical protein